MAKKKIDQLTISWDDWMKESLEDPKEAALYLDVALEEFQKDGEIQFLMLAIRRVAEAQGGLGKLAKKTRLNRENLYKTLSSRGNPRLDTIGRLFNALGFRMTLIRQPTNKGRIKRKGSGTASGKGKKSA